MPTRFSQAFTPDTGEVIVVNDPRELDVSSRLKQRLPSDLAVVDYLLHDRRLLQEQFTTPISTHSRVHADGIYVNRIVDQFQTGDGDRRRRIGPLLVCHGRVRFHAGPPRCCEPVGGWDGRGGASRASRNTPAQ